MSPQLKRAGAARPETFTRYFLRQGKEEFDLLLFDIDGTLSSGGIPLPGARELLELLTERDFPYLLLTNDSFFSHREKAGLLRRAGLPVSEEHIYSCGDALKLWKKQAKYRGELLFRCGRLGRPSYARQAGIRTTDDPEKLPRCAGVIFGEGPYDWQRVFEAVFNRFLECPDLPMIVVNPDSYWPNATCSGMGIGSGAQARFICGLLAEAGVKVEPCYIGKPYPLIYQGVTAELEERLGKKLRAGRIAMIGDSLASDIRGANAVGLRSCLVLSGITTPALAAQASPDRKPDLIFSAV